MSGHKRNGSTRSWRRLRSWVLDRDGHRCQAPDAGGTPARPGSWAAVHAPGNVPRDHDGRALVCNRYADHADHVWPWSRGGADTPENVRATCALHNLSKGDRPDDSTEEPTRRHRAGGKGWSW